MPDVLTWIRAIFARREGIPHGVDLAVESWGDVPIRPAPPTPVQRPVSATGRSGPPPVPPDARRGSAATVDNGNDEDWSAVIARAKADAMRTPLPLPLPSPKVERPEQVSLPFPPGPPKAPRATKPPAPPQLGAQHSAVNRGNGKPPRAPARPTVTRPGK